MNAIDMLEGQHREVEDLFGKLNKADRSVRKQKLFTQIADKLAVHAAIEEEAFYPAVKAQRTEDILLESLEEHLGIKRVLADLIDLDADDETFDAKTKVLQEQVEHHVGEEEDDSLPQGEEDLRRGDPGGDRPADDASAGGAAGEGQPAPGRSGPDRRSRAALTGCPFHPAVPLPDELMTQSKA